MKKMRREEKKRKEKRAGRKANVRKYWRMRTYRA